MADNDNAGLAVAAVMVFGTLGYLAWSREAEAAQAPPPPRRRITVRRRQAEAPRQLPEQLPAPSTDQDEALANRIAGAYGLDRPFARQIVRSARRINVHPFHLANVMAFESDGFKASIVNPRGGASGLIQFTKTTAAELGTTLEALRAMSRIEQMAYVERYFLLPRITRYGPLRTQLDVFMAVFQPPAIGKGRGYQFNFSAGTQRQNPGLYTAGDYEDLAMRRAKLPVEGVSVTGMQGYAPRLPGHRALLLGR
jgi:hypothetical protein